VIIRCHGARGSIPVSGKKYLKYGGDTTCIEIRTRNDEIIIIDAGSGIRRLGNRLMNEDHHRYHLLFTHSHWDHCLGFPHFNPIYHPKTVLDLIGCPTTLGNLVQMLAKLMTPPYFPISFKDIQARINYRTDACKPVFYIDSVAVQPSALSHPNLGMGYRLTEAGKSFVFLPDNELGYRHRGGRSYRDYAEFSCDADLLVHDAEYTPGQYEVSRQWGHSTYLDALDLALGAGVGCFGLTHHNQNRSDGQQDDIVADCRTIIARRGGRMECFALTPETEIIL
jgi:phosphoribosyl 1,2-cyclic phosphodiesterase